MCTHFLSIKQSVISKHLFYDMLNTLKVFLETPSLSIGNSYPPFLHLTTTSESYLVLQVNVFLIYFSLYYESKLRQGIHETDEGSLEWRGSTLYSSKRRYCVYIKTLLGTVWSPSWLGAAPAAAWPRTVGSYSGHSTVVLSSTPTQLKHMQLKIIYSSY